MAEKVYVLDATTRSDAPQPAAPPGRREKASRRDSHAREKTPARHAEPPRHEELFGRPVTPSGEASPHHEDYEDHTAVLPMSGYAPRPDWSRVPQLEEPMPEPWVKPQAPKEQEPKPKASKKHQKAPQNHAAQSSAPRRGFHPLGALVSIYTLGGVAPLALRVGVRQFHWAAMWIVPLTAWVTLAWFWTPVRAMMVSARLPILPFLAGLVMVHVVGALSWSRAVVRTVRDDRFQSNRLPRFLRTPAVAGVLGLVAPGSGLAVGGCSLRAGFGLWNAAHVLFASLLLAHAGLLWNWNTKEGVDALPKTFVEGIFVACALIVVAGGLVWLGTALDGARVQQRSSAPQGRRRLASSSDLVLAGLVLSVCVFAGAFRPVHVARDMDAFATALQFSGYRLIPLTLETAATALDPSRPEYAMRTAELHTAMGHTVKAKAIQAGMRERWEAYAQMLLQSGSAPPSTAVSKSPSPIQPAGDLVPRTPELAPSLTAGVNPQLPVKPTP